LVFVHIIINVFMSIVTALKLEIEIMENIRCRRFNFYLSL